jgi:hypothetical protein
MRQAELVIEPFRWMRHAPQKIRLVFNELQAIRKDKAAGTRR